METVQNSTETFMYLAENLRNISKTTGLLKEKLITARTIVATDHPLVRADGRRDDARGIQQLLRLADKKGIHIIFPPGRYILRRPLRLREHTYLEASDAAVFLKEHHGPMLLNLRRRDRMRHYTGNGNIIISGGKWNANYPAFGGGTSFVFAHAKNILIEKVQLLEHGGGHAIELNAVQHAEVRDCQFCGYDDRNGKRSYSEAIQLDLAKTRRVFPWGGSVFDQTACQDIWIHHNYFGPSQTKGSWGRAVGSHAATADRWHERIYITDNKMKETLQWAVRAFSWRDVVCFHNCLDTCGGGIAIHLNHVDGRNDTDVNNRPTGRSNPVKNILLIKNQISGGGGYGSAVRLKGSQTSPIEGAILYDNYVDMYKGKKAHITDTAYRRVSVKKKADICVNKM
ncbi:hypothetical protein [Terribacillus sp. DMT04]|uniref:hypothetical protein n=1 Tax=Terribacillus sp. DMT04 TaxID=2850441 RepID=UPI001C2C1E1E|nr:hypothetical protein [Terribacillus sp. DMT04]QXE00597.1 hypothetical protein KS242_11250 [Terribacillus sp. DMT04]